VIREKDGKKIISIRDCRISDVDIVLSDTDAEFLRTVLNERAEGGAKDDPEGT
jgi:hypothetical protein